MCYAYATYTRLGIVRYMLWSCVCLYVCLSQGHKAVFLSMQLNVSSRIYRLYCRGKESPAISHHCTYNQCVYRCRNIEGTPPPQLFSCRFCVDCMSGSRGQWGAQTPHPPWPRHWQWVRVYQLYGVLVCASLRPPIRWPIKQVHVAVCFSLTPTSTRTTSWAAVASRQTLGWIIIFRLGHEFFDASLSMKPSFLCILTI